VGRLPARRPYPHGIRHRRARRRPGTAARAARDWPRFLARRAGAHGPAAVRTLHEQGDDLCGRLPRGPPVGRGRRPRAARRRVRSLLRATHAMLFGSPPGIAPAGGGWITALPMAAALVALVLTGVAWPPGLAAALDLAARAI